MKNLVAFIATVAILLSTLIAGTIAYFQDTKSTTNVFTTGKVEISLDEPEWNDLTEEEKVLVPARSIAKDPTITVKGGSEDSHIRAQVILTEKLEDLTKPIALGDGWTLEEDGYYYYTGLVKKQVDDRVLPTIFSELVVRSDVTQKQLGSLEGSDLMVVINAYAIQAEGFASAKDAWDAFE